MTPSTNNERASIPSLPLSSFGSDVEPSNPKEGGGSSREDQVVGGDGEDGNREEGSPNDAPVQNTLAPEMEIIATLSCH